MIHAGEATRAAVVATAGAPLVVSLRDRDGNPQGGHVAIRDADGRRVPALFVVERENHAFDASPASEGTLPAARVCWLETALPPGHYEIEITPEDRAPVTRVFEALAGRVSTVVVVVD